MKKIFLLLCVVCLVLLSNSPLMAGGVDNRSNLSGEYARSLNRNAATDSLDAIAYNPAGVMAMQDGEQINLSFQYVTKDYKNIVNGLTYESDTPSVVPALFALYKSDKWAGFFAFTIPAGGGDVHYEHGDATTMIGATGLVNAINAAAGAAVYGPIVNQRLEGNEVYYGFTVGGAYKVDDFVSLSLAMRYINANRKVSAAFAVLPTAIGTAVGAPARTAVLDYTDEAQGVGLILGMDINYDPFIIGLRYETETPLDFKYDVAGDYITGLPSGLGASMGIINAASHKRNLPAVLAVGVGYKLTPKFRVDANITDYFQKNANWGGAENYVNNAWEAGLAIAYMPNPDLTLSVGYLHTDTGMSAMYALKEAPELNANSFGGGFQYHFNKNMKIDCGLTIVKYQNDNYTDISSGTPLNITFKKSVAMFSAGMQYRF